MKTEQAKSPGPAASTLLLRAAGNLKQLLAQLKAQSERSFESAYRLNQEIDGKMSRSFDEAGHVYSVFQVGPPHRLMVLRDVEELNGKKPRYTTRDFATAVHFANQRLADPVFPPDRPLDWDRLVRALQHLAKLLDQIETGNARLTGSGTAAEPYVSTGPLHVRAPLTLNFQAAPANLRLTAHGRVLRAAAASSP